MSEAVRLSYLNWLANEDTDRQQQYTKYREYYDGDHGTQLTARQRRYLQIKDGQEFNVNLCAVVIDSLAERLKVTGFSTSDEERNQSTEYTSQADLFWHWWEQNRMDGIQNDAHTAGVRDGDTYLLIEWDNENQRPRFCHELAYDGTDGVKLHYSSDRRGEPTFASKRWKVRAENPEDSGYVRRLNLYFPDRIEKYISDDREFEGAWRPLEEEGKPWPIVWTREGIEGGEPLGIPIVHFKNQGRGYNYGRSELVDAVPVQNALNKSVIDLLAAADTSAFRIYYVIGTDPGGLEVAPGAILSIPDPAAKLDSVEAMDLRPLIELVDSFKITMAQVTRTPVSNFQISGHRAAEGTLKQEEAGLVAKAKDRQVYFGNSWENAMMMARRLANVYGGMSLDETVVVSTVWDDPETRNEREFVETVALKREKLNIPLQVAWSEAGYSPAEIQAMEQTEEYQSRLAMQDAARRGLGMIGQREETEEDE